MSRKFVFSLILVFFLSFVFIFRTQFGFSKFSPAQIKILNINDSFLSFFNSGGLPELNELSRFYFLEDLSLPSTNFSDGEIQKTRERLKQLFEHYVFGYAPDLPSYELKLVSERTSVDVGNGVKAHIKDYDLILLLNKSNGTNPAIRLTLFLPENSIKPPVFLSMNKCGNHRVAIKDVVEQRNLGFLVKECNEDEFEKIQTFQFWRVDYIVSQGYALATFHESDIAPDDKNFYSSKLISFYKDSTFSGQHGWRTISAWAWGYRIVAKALRESSEVNSKKIIATGHSRRGKTALLATAFDPEIAMVIPHQSGTLGMALVRNHNLAYRKEYMQNIGFSVWPFVSSQYESIAINDFLFDHWFSDYTENFSWNESQLPLDQHLLLALIAPRPILSTEGLEDDWANRDSSLTTLRLANAFYEAYGQKGLLENKAYSQGELANQTSGQLAQVRLNTDHVLNVDYWKEMIEFANQKLK